MSQPPLEFSVLVPRGDSLLQGNFTVEHGQSREQALRELGLRAFGYPLSPEYFIHGTDGRLPTYIAKPEPGDELAHSLGARRREIYESAHTDSSV